MTGPSPNPSYAARLTIDYPEEPRNRGSVFVRLIIAVPALIVLSLVSGGDYDGDVADGDGIDVLLFTIGDGEAEGEQEEEGVSSETTFGFDKDAFEPSWVTGAGVGGVLFLPTLLTLLFVGRYPRWWFDWHLALTRYGVRVIGFLLLLRDEYPALEEEQAFHLDLDYPDTAELGRGMPLIKWLLALPHWICLALLGVVVLIFSFIAWLAILFTGSHPRGLFDFVVGVLRWGLRVEAYALLLITDRYPPFSLE